MISEIRTFMHMAINAYIIPGWMELHEGLSLYLSARFPRVEGRVVEIGAYCGRSTYYLASGLKYGDGSKVISIDHHKGSPEFESMKWIAGTSHYPKSNTLKIYKDNLIKRKVWENVEPMVMSSEDAAKLVNEPIRLLLIDGDHSYEGIKKDIELWLPKVVKGGLIFIHDAVNPKGFNGVYRAALELTTTGEFDFLDIDNSRIYEKRGVLNE